jgi:hypothetical protein
MGAMMCETFTAALPVDGASICVLGLDRQQSTIGASNPLAARVDALQLELGEGPRWDAVKSSAPALCSDLASDSDQRWPLFTRAVLDLGVGAVFALPMRMGNVVVGTVDLYSGSPQQLDGQQVSLAVFMADHLSATAAQIATVAADDLDSVEHPIAPFLRREVHQATGMIQAQLDTTSTIAFARLRAHAFQTDRPLDLVARDVVARRLDFSTLGD